MKYSIRCLSLLPALAAMLFAGTAAADDAVAATVTVIAKGLNNPRGLGFSPDGNLYVAEAGSGGAGNCRASPEPGNPDICYGETGALTRIDPQGNMPPRQVIRNLPSMAGPGGFAASSGPVDVDFFGWSAFVVMSWGGDPSLRHGIGRKSDLFGTVLRVLPNGRYFPTSNISTNEQLHNPAGGPVDSNPYGVAALPGRRVVADAGANAIIESWNFDWLRPRRNRTLAVLPPTQFGTEPVPTTVVQGPDGYLYVGQLTGAPFFRGSASIYRIPPHGGAPEVYLAGLTAIVDLAFDNAGNLYVLEIASGLSLEPGASPDPGVGNGRLLRKRPHADVETVLDGLTFPGGVAVGPDGALYVTDYGVFPGGGEVLRIVLD